jgi:hypothetical protein
MNAADLDPALHASAELAASEERLYRAYQRDRDDGMSHAQIVADGVYPNAEAYAQRYSRAEAAYVHAMGAPRRNADDSPGTTPWGERLSR